jgi:uncharacterized protein YdeI (YjbR/CyaY-like superfamily)
LAQFMPSAKPKFFATSDKFRSWLVEHHERETELLVGFYKVGSKKPSMTWSESVDEALCFGWIDAVRRGLDGESYTIRFTRRKPKSIWSAINVAKVEKLTAAGKMYPAGERAYALRSAARTAIYSFERKEAASLTAAEQREFERAEQAYAYFTTQAPWYQRTSLHWVVSAKRAETRARRLAQLIVDSAAGRRMAALTPNKVATTQATSAKERPADTQRAKKSSAKKSSAKKVVAKATAK